MDARSPQIDQKDLERLCRLAYWLDNLIAICILIFILALFCVFAACHFLWHDQVDLDNFTISMICIIALSIAIAFFISLTIFLVTRHRLRAPLIQQMENHSNYLQQLAEYYMSLSESSSHSETPSFATGLAKEKIHVLLLQLQKIRK